MARTFTDAERRILAIVQKDLPDTLTPFADIAKAAGPGVTEDMVIALLSRLKEEGVIRRFGASIKHQRAGWSANAMVGWIVRGRDVEDLGAKAASDPNVSHCYYRPSSVGDWPYELYTMVHGHSDAECADVVSRLEALLGLDDHMILKSVRELKKISPTYF
jgi:DNA-binding Lrp family transcriptional regulator